MFFIHADWLEILFFWVHLTGAERATDFFFLILT